MSIGATFQEKALPHLLRQPIVDPKTGIPTNYFLQHFQAWRAVLNGAARIIPCNATGTNLITLTPTHPVAPVIDGYHDYDFFVFEAEHDSTGSVTATVVPESGSLAALKVYVDGGATQAGASDVLAARLYVAIFNDALDGGAGGLVLK